jgi:hypothetical protein
MGSPSRMITCPGAALVNNAWEGGSGGQPGRRCRKAHCRTDMIGPRARNAMHLMPSGTLHGGGRAACMWAQLAGAHHFQETRRPLYPKAAEQGEAQEPLHLGLQVLHGRRWTSHHQSA